jgi:arylsulfatase
MNIVKKFIMNRNSFTILCLIIISLLVGACRHKSEIIPPNIVIIFTDDQGYEDLGCFGSPDIQTPNIDYLASHGTRFTNFHVGQAVCSASRASLLTGCYANRLGIHGALMPQTEHGLNPDEETIAEMLKKAGYATAIFGKWHLGCHPGLLPTEQGFDEYFGLPYSNDMSPDPMNNRSPNARNYPPLPLYDNDSVIMLEPDQSNLTTWYTERAVDFINRQKDHPFFLYVPHSMPHVPLYVSEKFKGKSDRGLYGDVIMEIDWSVGEIINALEENDLLENTFILYTSDNGPWLIFGDHSGSAGPLREGKGTSWEGGVRVPAIMHWPGKIPAGRECRTPLMTIDILPTLAHITGTSLPEKKIDGLNVWPIIAGDPGAKNPHDAYFIYYEVNQLQALISGDWKMIFPHRYRTIHDAVIGHGGQPGEYNHLNIEEVELYNIGEDITESVNVAADFPDVIMKLSILADSCRTDIGDALTGVEGKNSRKPGMRSNIFE